MTSALTRCAIGLALVAMPNPALAKSITYDCDTAANHFSELSLPVDGTTFSVTGNVKLNALAGSKTYVALARVQIASAAAPGKSPDVYAGFALSALPASAKKTPSGSPAVQMLSYSVNGKDDEILPLSLMTDPGTVQPFTLTYDGNHVVVNIGAESKTFPVKTNDPVVRLVCSTGEFLFTDVTITASR